MELKFIISMVFTESVTIQACIYCMYFTGIYLLMFAVFLKVTGAIQLIPMDNAKKSFDVFSTSLSK